MSDHKEFPIIPKEIIGEQSTITASNDSEGK